MKRNALARFVSSHRRFLIASAVSVSALFLPFNAQALFVGVKVNGIAGNSSFCSCLPPDPSVAVGTVNVVQLVNTSMEILDKSGNILSGPTSLPTFFTGHGFTPNTLSDPVVIFDESIVNASGPNGRFIIMVNDLTSANATNFLDFAISNDADATHGFTNFRHVNVGETNFFAESEGRLGMNHDAYFMGLNMFFTGNGAYDHSQIFTIDKASFIAGNFTTYHHDLPNTNVGPVPAIMRGDGAGGPAYFVVAEVSPNTITVITETNVLSNSPTDVLTTLPVASYSPPPPAPQPSGSVTTNDERINSAAWRNNILVAAHAVGTGSPLVAHARWYQINTSSTPTLTQSGEINPGPGVATYFPSIDIDAAGNLGMTYIESSANEFISMYVTGRTPGDPLGTMQTGVVARTGTANYTGTRMGDFSRTCVDPSDGVTFWATNEFSNNSSAGLWATGIASLVLATQATFTVTTTDDHDDGTCNAPDCTLREAINASNARGGPNLIAFAPGVTGTIQLASALSTVNGYVTLQGPGADQLTVRRNTGGNYRIFTISPNSIIAFSGLTIANGNVVGNASNIGGGILNDHANLTLTNCVVTGNSAFDGGGIYNDGETSGSASLTIIDSALSANAASGSGATAGGGIYSIADNGGNATLVLTNSTLSNNTAGFFAGGIANFGSGGNASATLTNCTLNSSQIRTDHATITMANSIFAFASGGNLANLMGTNISKGHNLSSDNAGDGTGTGPGGLLSGPGDIRNTDPLFDPAGLTNNGGTTPTIALQSNSPAIDTGDDTLAPKTDQRGYLRVGVSDRGAFELGGTRLRITSIIRLGNGHISLQGIGVPSAAHTIQASPDLSLNSFISVDSVTADANGNLQYDDAAAVSLNIRFYRILFSQ